MSPSGLRRPHLRRVQACKLRGWATMAICPTQSKRTIPRGFHRLQTHCSAKAFHLACNRAPCKECNLQIARNRFRMSAVSAVFPGRRPGCPIVATRSHLRKVDHGGGLGTDASASVATFFPKEADHEAERFWPMCCANPRCDWAPGVLGHACECTSETGGPKQLGNRPRVIRIRHPLFTIRRPAMAPCRWRPTTPGKFLDPTIRLLQWQTA